MATVTRCVLAGGGGHLRQVMISDKAEQVVLPADSLTATWPEDQRYYRYTFDEASKVWIFIFQNEFVPSEQVQEAMDKACEPWEYVSSH